LGVDYSLIPNFGSNVPKEDMLKWKKWNPRKRLLEFFFFFLVFSDCVMQHLEDDAKTNLEDGK
jgi:hypothetical protein